MADTRTHNVVTPSWKVVLGLIAIAIAGNVIGKVLAPNGPSGGAKGIVADVGMAVFFAVAVYLVVVGVVALVRSVRDRRSASA